MTNDEQTVVVLGASLGGLLTAAALADTSRDVVLVERDRLLDDAAPRRGVPQARHAHGLLAGGLSALDELLPGLSSELARAGSPTGDNLRDAAWVFGGKRLALGTSGVRGMTIARPSLEGAVRRRVLSLANVRLLAGSRATGLIERAGAVRGVRIEDESGREQVLGAQLVVDASGRNSELPAWLTALGRAAPRVERVALETNYVSRIYQRRPHHLDGGIALLIVSDPASPRGGIALALDEHQWIVSQYAFGRQRPPTDPEGFLAFARSLASPELARILEDSAPLGDAATMRFSASVRRRYEEMRDLPQGLLVSADALSSFNPTFGQGITVAAKQALALRDLRAGEGRPGLTKAFFRRAAKIVDVAWDASVGRTFLYEGVGGRPSFRMRLGNAYLPHVVSAAHTDVEVATALLRTLHFLEPPETLFAPRILRSVLRMKATRGPALLEPHTGPAGTRA